MVPEATTWLRETREEGRSRGRCSCSWGWLRDGPCCLGVCEVLRVLFGWRMAAGDLAHSGGDLENQPAWVLGFSLGAWFFPGCLAFSCCLPVSHPQHQRLGFRVGSSEGEGRDRTEILTAWLKTFPFLFLFYYYYFKRGVHVVFLCCPREGAGVGSL